MIIAVESYNGSISLIKDLRNLISEEHPDLFLVVIVHGSIATDEVIPYSDFDGLLIVRDEYKNSKKLSGFLKKSMKIIHRFDPLQHHGWFIIYESQLKRWPQSYFPVELLNFSRVIYPESNLTLDIHVEDNPDFRTPFLSLSGQLEKKLANNFRPKGMFQLKSLVSEILLLPALYYQAKHKKGIFKKHSFDAVGKEVSPEVWQAIETCSSIRNEWQYSFTLPRWLFVRTKNTKYLKRFTRKYLAPPVPEPLQRKLTDDFYKAVSRFVRELKSMVNEV